MRKVSPFEYALDQAIHDMQTKEGVPLTVDMTSIERKTDKEMRDELEADLNEQMSRIKVVNNHR